MLLLTYLFEIQAQGGNISDFRFSEEICSHVRSKVLLCEEFG